MKAYLIKYGEIGIKGKNRSMFEDTLARQIRQTLGGLGEGYTVSKERGRIYAYCPDDHDEDAVIDAMQHIFGIVGICPVKIYPCTDPETLRKDMCGYMDEVHPDFTGTFKVKAKRINKAYPMGSMDTDAYIGEAILEHCPGCRVDVHDPEVLLDIEIRDRVYAYSKVIPGPGGMPVGTNGKATLLLSGGIDSPVAGYMIGKRGVILDAVYFHAPPYTSERAKEKVVDLAKIIASYTGPIWLRIVNFTDMQLHIYDTCPHEELTIIMRRYMMRIAEHFAKEGESIGLITGESIGQVASQTMQSLLVTNDVCTLPVYRPLIGFDKSEIVDISKKIGAYETSILPYEDCCTIFVAKHPVTKPNLNIIRNSEMRLGKKMEELMQTAIDTAELVKVSGALGKSAGRRAYTR